MISAILRDKEWSAGGMYVFKRSLGGLLDDQG